MKFKQKNLRICPDRGVFYFLEDPIYEQFKNTIALIHFHNYTEGCQIGGMHYDYKQLTFGELSIYEEHVTAIKEALKDPLLEIEMKQYKQRNNI